MVPLSLMPLGEERDMWDWGSQQQAVFKKAKLLMKQFEALGVSQTGLPFKLEVSVTPKVYESGTVAETKEGENVPKIKVPTLEGNKTPTGSHRARAFRSVHSSPLGGAS